MARVSSKTIATATATVEPEFEEQPAPATHEPVGHFTAYCGGFSAMARTEEVELKLRIPMHEWEAAQIPAREPSMTFRYEIHRPIRKGRLKEVD